MFLTFVPDYRLDPPPYRGYPRCPVCGSDMYEYIYKAYGDVCGCSECVKIVEAEDYAEEEEERGRN